MNESGVLFEQSPYYLLLFLLISIGIAYLFYFRGNSSWNKKTKWSLASLRAILIFSLLVLILSPTIRYLTRETEDPIIVIAIDNSLSVDAIYSEEKKNALKEKIEQLSNELQGDGIQIQLASLGNERNLVNSNEVSFDKRNSDLRSLLRNIQDQFEGRNLVSVVLLSDGIYNSGTSPNFQQFPFQIQTVGLGDTTVRKDLIIQQVNYNKVSYEGNQFPIEVEIVNQGYESISSVLSLVHKGKEIARKTINLDQKNDYIKETFLIKASEKGNQRYLLRLSPVEGEFTEQNNTQNAFIEVVEGKEKIALIAKNPHPDIKALSAVIDLSPNYELDLYIPGISKEFPDEDRYDLLILHHLSPNDPLLLNLKGINPKNTPVWVFYRAGIDSRDLPINLSPRSAEMDYVAPYYNSAFPYFTLSEDLSSQMREWPPLWVPFGEASPSAGAEVLLLQKVGSVETNKSLLILKGDSPRSALMLGEGFWRWRLDDYQKNESHQLFNELVTKTIQFLSTKNDTRKIRVYPLETDKTDQSILVETEVYNDLYERIYGEEIQIKVTDEEGIEKNYEYTVAEGNSRYRITGLHPGIFKYTASTQIGGKQERVNGEFVLSEQQIEFADLQANHQLLRELAKSNEGRFYQSDEMELLRKDIIDQAYSGTLRSFTTYSSVLNLPAILILILAIATFEWFIRKYQGSY